MLEVLTFNYGMLPQAAMLLVRFVTMLVGAVLAALLLGTPTEPLSRSHYFLRICIATALLTAAQLSWLFHAQSLRAGVSWLMMASDFAAGLAFGAYQFRIAQQRSLDAYGHYGRAWLAFVPIANLFLVFQPSQNPGAAPRSGWAVAIGLAFAVLSRLSAPYLVAEVEQRTATAMQDPGFQAIADIVRIRAIGTAAALDDLIVAEGAPVQIEPGLTLTAVTRADLHLTYAFAFDQADAVALAADYRALVTQNFCGALMSYLTAGASASLQFNRADGLDLGRVEVSLAECTA